ncbi:LuxR C-terminal-related transcriptional regulator [Cellulomonas endometrii]|uniref:LuxR C-terminal-related transcriptional regulator n=1 Tax=Cellulomonas endometrii TaxID=3036301 RepID=UPI0024ACDC87|nr:LuxR C-terminal-related transcriptional regulator [Cellulomonas endometrii]
MQAAPTGRVRVPPARPDRVARPRLLDVLASVTTARLTVVTAPAGYGKSTLLAQWFAAGAGDARVGWVALDDRDGDPAVLWPSVLDALDAAVPGACAVARGLLDAGEPVPVVLAAVVDALADVEGHVVLVLDDVHLAGPGVWPDLGFLVDHLPPRAHVVLAGRSDPAVPLPRLRARGELVELGPADLRLTSDEVGAVVAAADVALEPSDLALLSDRTEGWAAAVQLALLAVRAAPDGPGVLARITGEHRHLADYLGDEVLNRQPDELRDFLLRTSVLSRLTGPLCDAVTGTAGGAVRLEELDRAQLFLVPLDDERRWFRYHHLFGELLASRLTRERPAEVADLHLRAGRWWAERDEPAEAVRHALAGGDLHGAAALVEAAVPAMRRARQEATVRQWCDALPPDVVGARPALALGYAGALLAEGRLDGVAELLGHVERAVGVDGDGPVPPESAPVVAQAAVFRAAQARAAGDDAGAARHAGRALDLLAPDEHLGRGAAAGLLGLAAWSDGDLEAAERWWGESLAALLRAEHHADTFGALLALGDIRTAQGRLTDAADGYTRALETADGLRGAADLHVGLAGVLRERDELDAARRHVDAAAALGPGAALPQNRHRALVVDALIRAAQGDTDAAVGLLDEAERHYVADYFPDVRPVAAVRTSVQARAGHLVDARRWVGASGVRVDDEPTYRREAEHLTLVRVLLAEHRAGGDRAALTGADQLLERLLAAAEAGGRAGSVLEVLALRALVRRGLGDMPGALDVLDRAVRLAAREGHVRVLADEGAPMAALLRRLADRPGAHPSTRVLRAAAERTAAVRPTTPDRPDRSTGPVVAPLTARERDVLRLLGGDLDGPAMARELGLSLNTLRTHTRNVYAKLGVQNRRAAVRRGEELGLLGGRPAGR